jgi:hypothetical protein
MSIGSFNKARDCESFRFFSGVVLLVTGGVVIGIVGGPVGIGIGVGMIVYGCYRCYRGKEWNSSDARFIQVRKK